MSTHKDAPKTGVDATLPSIAPGSGMPPSPPPPLGVELDFSPGDVVAGRHVVQYYLADSALSSMYVARHASVTSLIYVLKVLKKEFSTIHEIIHQFRAEATTIAQLRDPHSLRVTDMGLLPDGRPFICREFCRGILLSDLLRRKGPLPTSLVYRIARGVLSSLSEAHEFGVVHRDIRPVGLILAPEHSTGEVRCRVLDFGTAYIGRRSQLSSQGHATNPSLVLCAPQYAAPELLRGRISPAADIYSFGHTLCELLDGEPLVPPGTFMEVAQAQLARDEWQLGPRASASALAPMIRRALAKDPDARYADAAEMLDDILRNVPATFDRRELQWARWSQGSTQEELTPRAPVHQARMLSARANMTTGEVQALRPEDAHDVLLNDFPTAMRLARLQTPPLEESSDEDVDALFDDIDAMSSPARRPATAADDPQDLLLAPLPKIGLEDDEETAHAGTIALRRAPLSEIDALLFESDGPIDAVTGRFSRDDVRPTQDAPGFPTLLGGDALVLHKEDSGSRPAPLFSASDFLDDEELDEPPIFGTALDAQPATSHVAAPASSHVAERISTNAPSSEPQNPEASSALDEQNEAALDSTIVGTPTPAVPLDSERMDAFRQRARELHRIETKQNRALLLRGALISVISALIFWTLLRACG